MPSNGTKLLRSGLTPDEHAYVTAALTTEQRRTVLLAAAERQSEPTAFRPAGETVIVVLASPLPCSIRAGTPDGICGKPATIAHAWPQEPSGPWPTPGLWTVQPVCAECAKAAARVYAEHA